MNNAMTGMRPLEHANLLHARNRKFDAEIREQAAQFREGSLLPICREFQLSFYSGNGTFSFMTADGKEYENVSRESYPEMSGDMRGALAYLLICLTHPIGNDSLDMFGFYVETYEHKG